MDTQQIREFLDREGLGVHLTIDDEASLRMDDDYITDLVTEMTQNPPAPAAAIPVGDIVYQGPLLFQESPVSNEGFITLNPAGVTMIALPSHETAVGSPCSPCPSEASTTSYENLCSMMSNTAQSPTASYDVINQVVSPVEVFGERKRKRGRKPKSEAGRNLPKGKKPKIYEISQPFENKEQERKRLNAVNAKRHRDMQKQAKESVEKQLQEVKMERDKLQQQVEELQKREAVMQTQMMGFKEKLQSLFSDVGR